MENIFELDNGDYLVNDYGKYRPNLSFLCKTRPDEGRPWVKWTQKKGEEFNIGNTSVEVVRGKYWVSKKGTKCFRPDENGPHMLIADQWGGAFNKYRGDALKELPDQLYYRRASSNGGGVGTDYVVVPVGTRRKISVDDI